MSEQNEDFNVSIEAVDSQQAIDLIQQTLEDFLATADVTSVYGEPVRTGDTVVIPAAETLAVLGFGAGYGSGSGDEDNPGQGSGGGGGGGGRTFSRPVAVIIASPDGVRVKPIYDLTKVVLATLTTLGFMLAFFMRLRRPYKTLKGMQDGEIL